MRLLLPSALAAVLLPLAVACSASEPEDPGSTEAQITAPGSEGSVCDADAKCGPGLVCKGPTSGPPPGAVGLPLPATAVKPQGLPGSILEPSTCQRPAPGAEGATCVADSDCNEGLSCTHAGSSSSSGGPPPGAVGLPLPSGTSQPQGRPVVVGLPIPPAGTCRSSSGSSSSGGSPPGAVGLPILP